MFLATTCTNRRAQFRHKLSARNPFQLFKRTLGLLSPGSESTEHRVKRNFDEQASRMLVVSVAAHDQTGQDKLSVFLYLNCPIGRVMSNDKVDYYKVDLGSSSVDSSCPSPALQPSPMAGGCVRALQGPQGPRPLGDPIWCMGQGRFAPGIDQTRHLHTFKYPAHPTYRRHIRPRSRHIRLAALAFEPRRTCLINPPLKSSYKS
ncbi:hypothetical protein B0H13DRAFT_1926465 [Mycena leptocephala]|nr:hypothetical protein B0H13DRAFT_1926465 [Mycena leptocephala]